MTNILILSAGTRNKIVHYFKENTDGKVIATDMQAIAPSIYDADKFYIVPHITDPDYINIILDICQKENISGVLSLIDPELSLLAQNKDKFESINVKIIGSSYELCEMSLDKMKMYHWLSSHNYNCAKSYDSLQNFYRDLDNSLISFPVFVKPVKGSASIAISKVSNKESLELLFKYNDNLMIQEFLNGQEIGVDCYIDLITHKPVSIFTKKKLLMRAGETDKAVSFKDPALFELISKFIEETGFIGQIDIDIFNINGTYYISEVNPRFGGGYPHAYECGCNSMKLIINNINGIANSECIADYEENVYMMKYNEICIKKLNQ